MSIGILIIRSCVLIREIGCLSHVGVSCFDIEFFVFSVFFSRISVCRCSGDLFKPILYIAINLGLLRLTIWFIRHIAWYEQTNHYHPEIEEICDTFKNWVLIGDFPPFIMGPKIFNTGWLKQRKMTKKSSLTRYWSVTQTHISHLWVIVSVTLANSYASN